MGLGARGGTSREHRGAEARSVARRLRCGEVFQRTLLAGGGAKGFAVDGLQLCEFGREPLLLGGSRIAIPRHGTELRLDAAQELLRPAKLADLRLQRTLEGRESVLGVGERLTLRVQVRLEREHLVAFLRGFRELLFRRPEEAIKPGKSLELRFRLGLRGVRKLAGDVGKVVCDRGQLLTDVQARLGLAQRRRFPTLFRRK